MVSKKVVPGALVRPQTFGGRLAPSRKATSTDATGAAPSLADLADVTARLTAGKSERSPGYCVASDAAGRPWLAKIGVERRRISFGGLGQVAALKWHLDPILLGRIEPADVAAINALCLDAHIDRLVDAFCAGVVNIFGEVENAALKAAVSTLALKSDAPYVERMASNLLMRGLGDNPIVVASANFRSVVEQLRVVADLRALSRHQLHKSSGSPAAGRAADAFSQIVKGLSTEAERASIERDWSPEDSVVVRLERSVARSSRLAGSLIAWIRIDNTLFVRTIPMDDAGAPALTAESAFEEVILDDAAKDWVERRLVLAGMREIELAMQYVRSLIASGTSAGGPSLTHGLIAGKIARSFASRGWVDVASAIAQAFDSGPRGGSRTPARRI